VIGQTKFIKWLKRLSWSAMAMSPILAVGAASTTVTWQASPDSSVTGYNIYYGTESGNYTNKISVGNVTNVAIENLAQGTSYFFAAKSRDAANDESDFSNEASFAGYHTTPKSFLRIKAMPLNLTNDQVVFTLASGAPAGAVINSITGVLTWNPNLSDANTVNNITVIITDLTNPGASRQTTFSVTVSDFLDLAMASVPVQTGQSASLPIAITSSDGVTNLTFSVNWPGGQLLNPSLTFNPPIAGGTLLNQGTNLVIQLWTAGSDVLIGTNQIAQINFQAAAGQPSAFINLPVAIIDSVKSNTSSFANVTTEAGEVVVVGNNSLLRSSVDQNQNRTLNLYTNPGSNYQLQSSTDLSSPANWQPVQNFQPTNILQTISLDSANPVIFYRLMQE
jgi:hypothetical protein